jgi:hypothetical protein
LFATLIVNAVGKFSTDVIDTGGNLSQVMLMPVMHLDLGISQRNFEKVLK